jgi:aspartyl/glutamyl-tRNA(Asn/Gln) amidotransferase C subunit
MQEEKITVEMVRDLARLSGLAIPEEDLEGVAAAFNRVLPALNKMMALDLKDIEPTYAPTHRQEPKP